jgi:serine protease Do
MPYRTRPIILVAIVILAAAAAAGFWVTGRAGHLPFNSRPVVVEVAHAASAAAGGDVSVSFANGFAPVAKMVLPAVANIASSKIVRSAAQGSSPFFSEPFFRQFFGDQFSNQFRVPREQREQSLGSGVIVNPEGYILTNNHVVDGASDIKVTLADNREFQATIIGTDPRGDLAVVKVNSNNLPVLTLGDSSHIEVGNFVLAVGNPFGVGRTVTMGIVSATGRSPGVEDYEDFIQTDAAINPGNSGGALVNVRGELIGINTAIVTGGGGGNQGVGFAVPINMARKEMEEIIKNGKVVRGWLGVEVQPVTPAIAKAFGAPESHGAVIADVTAGGPAAKSGLKRGDIVVDLDGMPVDDSRQLSLKIAQSAPGTTAKLRVLRDGKPQELTVTLGELPSKAGPPVPANDRGTGPHLGISVETLTPDLAHQFGVSSGTTGVVVSEVESGSAAAEAGLERGDVIQQVNRKPVASANEFATSIGAGGKQPVLLLIDRGGNHLYLVVTPH